MGKSKSFSNWQTTKNVNYLTAGESFVGMNVLGGILTLTISTVDIQDNLGTITIKDYQGNSGTNNITIVAENGATFDGAVSYTLNVDYASATFRIIDDMTIVVVATV